MAPKKKTGLDPAAVRAWVRIFRDICAVIVSLFLAVYGATHYTDLGPAGLTALLGFAATFLGAPIWFRRDEARHNGEESDEWSGKD